MIHPKHLQIKDYTYDLPADRIAKYPVQERDASKLLIYHNGKITEDVYKNLNEHLPPDSLLVFNDTKVIEARLLFKKPSGALIEIFCLEPHERYIDMTTAMKQKGEVLWQCLIGGASKWKHGQVLEKKIKTKGKEIILKARYVEKRADCFVIEFSWSDNQLSVAEILHEAGAIPLPPYIKREVEKSDSERYQTIFAHYEGSVASPTAGLHFTNDLLKKLKAKNITTDFVTLHVGAGTFKPVKTETLEEHEMHAEFISISKKTIEDILQNLGGSIVPVGTTSLRVIESIYWLGVKISRLPIAVSKTENVIDQWEAYDLEKYNVSPSAALRALLEAMNKEKMERLVAKTQILIAPSYKVKIANGLITNFHQPQSTLLLLVAALIGDDWKKIYRYALENNFRFLSYGDGCLLWYDKQSQAGTGEIAG
jgi:S-adenosylmethionine:tRNA ribosyltransferase-isomerase